MPTWKRVMDIVGSLVACVCLSPVLLLVAFVIKVVSPGPVLLRQKRVGHHGKTFTIWKFRTMKADADSAVHQNHVRSLMTTNQPMTKLDLSRDPRIIPFGNFIRRCCLDELPQLINVLRGEMSLVGPRPCVPYEAEQYGPRERKRFDAVPGMTGLWQVSGKNRTTFNEMIRLDINYARSRSFWLDIKILLWTMPAIYAEIAESLSQRRKHKTQQAPAPVQTLPQPLDAGQLGTQHD